MTKLHGIAALDAAIVNLQHFYGRPDFLRSCAAVTELDMGCGKGSFATLLAARYPERTVLAADVLSDRLRKLVRRNLREKVDNMIVLKSEARMLIARTLPDAFLDRLHILCPDPWPKDKHRANRLLTSDFMTQIHRVLKVGGVWHFSTDDPVYHDAVVRAVAASGLFREDPGAIADIADLKTDFELLWNSEGRTVRHHGWVTLPLPRPAIGH